MTQGVYFEWLFPVEMEQRKKIRDDAGFETVLLAKVLSSKLERCCRADFFSWFGDGWIWRTR